MNQVSFPDPVKRATPPNLTASLEGGTVVEADAGEFRLQRIELTEGKQSGVQLLLIDTGRVRAAICPTRGMGLWKAEIDGVACGWSSPVTGPVHPTYVAVEESSGIGWLDGFDELLVRCGLRNFGAPDFDGQGRVAFPLHGRVANLPASDIQVHLDKEQSRLEVSGVVSETRFLQYNLQLRAKYTFAIGEPTIEIHDRVTNAGGTPTTMQMLYHVNFGAPLLNAGSRFFTAADRIVARDSNAETNIANWSEYGGPEAGFAEQVYFSAAKAGEDGWAVNLLSNANQSQAVAVHFDASTLPFVTQWKNTVATADGYVTGIEPGTGFPNPRSFEEEQGRVVSLDGGDSIDFRVKIEGLSDAGRIRALCDHLMGDEAPVQVGFDDQWCTPR